MHTILILVSLCAHTAHAHSEPLAAALRRRSDGYGAYGGDYNQDYEPYVFAAVPLHAPLPVLRVLSPMPLTSLTKHRLAASYQHPVYARPPYDADFTPANSNYELIYGEPLPSAEAHHKKHKATHPKAQYQRTSVASEPEETILYARPTPQGGYVYRKRPGNARSPPKITRSPIIFRIHKYKVIKDDR